MWTILYNACFRMRAGCHSHECGRRNPWCSRPAQFQGGSKKRQPKHHQETVAAAEACTGLPPRAGPVGETSSALSTDDCRDYRKNGCIHRGAFISQDATAALLSATHFNPLAKLCGSREEVADLLQLMGRAGVQADATTFAILQELGLKAGHGKATAEALEVSFSVRRTERRDEHPITEVPALPEHTVHSQEHCSGRLRSFTARSVHCRR